MHLQSVLSCRQYGQEQERACIAGGQQPCSAVRLESSFATSPQPVLRAQHPLEFVANPHKPLVFGSAALQDEVVALSLEHALEVLLPASEMP